MKFFGSNGAEDDGVIRMPASGATSDQDTPGAGDAEQTGTRQFLMIPRSPRTVDGRPELAAERSQDGV